MTITTSSKRVANYMERTRRHWKLRIKAEARCSSRE